MLQATRRNFEPAAKQAGASSAWRERGLRLFANLLLVTGAAGLITGTAVMVQDWSRRTTIAAVQVEGDFRHVSQQEQMTLLRPVVQGGYFSVDLEAIRKAALQSPWVEEAVVSRQWPDAVRVQIIEKQPVARWGKQGLISSKGELFLPVAAEGTEALPMLFGPANKARYVMEQFRSMNGILRGLGMHIVELQLTDRMSWFLRLDNGMQVVVDQADTIEKLQRFAYLYQRQLEPDAANITSIDLRYRNGVAVGWKLEKSLKNVQSGV